MRMINKNGQIKPMRRSQASILSPLRYPGSKRRLAVYITNTLKLNTICPKVLIEPFAGGASVSLQLLKDKVVSKLILGERDPLVASFWKTVFTDPDWLIDAIQNIEVSLENWLYFKYTHFRSKHDQALACIFLNRTSFSGILSESSGPIGGYNQATPYGINCRFTINTIVKRIRQASMMGEDVILVNQGGWRNTLEKAKKQNFKPKDMFYYFDPPFYNKADRLYRYYFNKEDHSALKRAVLRLKSPWFLSYDPADEIKKLYGNTNKRTRKVELIYSVSGNGNHSSVKELVICNLPRLPRKVRLWRTNAEWKSI